MNAYARREKDEYCDCYGTSELIHVELVTAAECIDGQAVETEEDLVGLARREDREWSHWKGL